MQTEVRKTKAYSKMARLEISHYKLENNIKLTNYPRKLCRLEIYFITRKFLNFNFEKLNIPNSKMAFEARKMETKL